MISTSMQFRSRSTAVALATKITLCLLAADVSLAAGKFLLVNGLEPTSGAAPAAAPSAKPASLPRDGSQGQECRSVIVEIDEGYGVSDHVTRWVCRRAL